SGATFIANASATLLTAFSPFNVHANSALSVPSVGTDISREFPPLTDTAEPTPRDISPVWLSVQGNGGGKSSSKDKLASSCAAVAVPDPASTSSLVPASVSG